MLQLKPPLIDEFLNSHTVSTANEYRRDLQRFFEFIQYTSVDSISIGQCLNYRASLNGLSMNTINRRLNSVRSYFTFNVRYGSLKFNPMDSVPHSKGRFEPTQGLTDAETMLVLSKARNPLESVVLHCLFYLGLRRAELCSIRVQDLGSDGQFPSITILGKGNKQRRIGLPQPVFESIKMYLNSRARSIREVSDPLFSMEKTPTKPLHSNTVFKIFKRAVRAAGLDEGKFSPHSARVTAVSNALENGASPTYVQYMGGWATPQMISTYDRRKEEIKNSAVWKINYSK